jgi:hypothetical protein
MSTYYLEIECTGVVPEEEWIKVFRQIKEDVVGPEQLIKIEFGTVDEDGLHTDDTNML